MLDLPGTIDHIPCCIIGPVFCNGELLSEPAHGRADLTAFTSGRGTRSPRSPLKRAAANEPSSACCRASPYPYDRGEILTLRMPHQLEEMLHSLPAVVL